MEYAAQPDRPEHPAAQRSPATMPQHHRSPPRPPRSTSPPASPPAPPLTREPFHPPGPHLIDQLQRRGQRVLHNVGDRWRRHTQYSGSGIAATTRTRAPVAPHLDHVPQRRPRSERTIHPDHHPSMAVGRHLYPWGSCDRAGRHPSVGQPGAYRHGPSPEPDRQRSRSRSPSSAARRVVQSAQATGPSGPVRFTEVPAAHAEVNA